MQQDLPSEQPSREPATRRAMSFKSRRPPGPGGAANPPQRSVRRSVYFYDGLAHAVVSLGGLAVIAAVLAICFYLVAATLPLFRAGQVEPDAAGRLDGGGGVVRPVQSADVATDQALRAAVAVAVDEYRGSVAVLTPDGMFRLVHLESGTLVEERRVLEGGEVPTAWSFDQHRGLLAIGYGDGAVQLGRVGFVTTYPVVESLPAGHRDMPVGTTLPLVAQAPGPDNAEHDPGGEHASGILERIGPALFRLTLPVLELREPQVLDRGAGAIRAIDYRARGGGEFVVALREDGTAVYDLVRTIRPLGGGPPRVRVSRFDLPLSPPQGGDAPDRLFVTGDGSSVYALWRDGYVQRYASRNPAQVPIALAESMAVLDDGRSVSTAGMLLGATSLLIGDDRGTIHVVFAATDEAAPAPDRQRLVVAHRYGLGNDAITSIGISRRDRSIAAGDSAGNLFIHNILSGKRIAAVPAATDGAVRAAIIMPKGDGVLAIGEDGGYRTWHLDPGHPQASFRSLFGRVHYEGALEPQFVYQATSGEDAAEPKLSIVPLITGTLKATVFAMLFAAPIAVLAAIYTSEFMQPGLRNAIKPGIEMMASLPSVVLGFIAAIIVAPYVAGVLPAILIGFAVVPIGLLLAAHLWQLIPTQLVSRMTSAGQLAIIGLVLALSLGAAATLGPIAERALFRPDQRDLLVAGGLHEPVPRDQWPAWVGHRQTMSPDQERHLRLDGFYFRDGQVVQVPPTATDAQRAAALRAAAEAGLDRASIRNWLDGNIGGPWPGWVLVMMVPATLLVVFGQARFINRRFNNAMAWKPPLVAGLWQSVKFFAAVAAIIVLSVVLATVATRMGYDTRDVIFGPFTMRNTLVVGLIMGFAVIPIIYTISEDAMNSVPSALRSASLGAGATQWQTAVRIVLPVAASGIFSACMIGLGRAVGETMIVVMATGNTPTMDMNIFSGFRTLSANIAVELPEAPSHSTHFSFLFLCGLVLFAMTFAINTTAEIVRQHFRRRSASL